MGALVKMQSGLTEQAEEHAPEQFLLFTLGGETFAIGISHIREIIEFGTLTTVPMMPAFIRGVINVRGAVVPVIDLAARLGGETCKAERRACIVILENNREEDRQRIGILVDGVSEVLEIAATEIEPAPAFGARIRNDFIQGMGKVRGQFVILLDVGHVLSVDEMAALSGIEAMAA